MKENSIKPARMVLMGYWIVNIPITIIILIVGLLVARFSSLSFGLSFIIGAAAGWIYWGFAVNYWIKWALKNGAQKNDIHKFGVRWLLLWKKDIARIERIETALKSNHC